MNILTKLAADSENFKSQTGIKRRTRQDEVRKNMCNLLLLRMDDQNWDVEG